MKAVAPAPKRLIICCDGTWQSSVTGARNIPSNVTRLARTIAKAGQDSQGKTWQQVVYYDSGVGTGSLSWYEQARQGGTGDGLVINVLEAYNFLVNNYNEGDQIYCFGFSRGAFTARCVAGLVTDIGVFKPDNMQSFAPLWAAYQKNMDKHEFRKTKDYFQFINGGRMMVPEGEESVEHFRKPSEMPHQVEGGLTYPRSNVVEVVGCFDTVGSLGFGDTRLMNNAWSRHRFEYLNVKLSPFIKHAFHALALDEHREPFLPTLWYIPNEATLNAEEHSIDRDDDDWLELKAHRDEIDKQIREHQELHKPDLFQVWFPGVHINIGGGSDEYGSDGEGLANITFAWMVQQLGPYLAFEPWTWGQKGIAGYQQRLVHEEWRYGSMKPPGTVESMGNWLYEQGRKVWKTKEAKKVPLPDKLTKNPAAPPGDKNGKDIQWAISSQQESYTTMYKALNWSVMRSPGECTDRSTDKKTPLKELGATNEYIHPSFWWRSQKLEGDDLKKMRSTSPLLLNFERTRDGTYGSWGYRKKDTGLWIPEWFVTPTKSYMDKKYGQHGLVLRDGEAWDHAEWTYTDNIVGSGELLQPQLSQFYLDAQAAVKKMEEAGKKFPFEV